MNEKMEMTTPVVTRKVQSVGEKMEMTTPVITRKVNNYLIYKFLAFFFFFLKTDRKHTWSSFECLGLVILYIILTCS